jgi:formamidopyrimidine-DNA glycosylase
MPELPEVETVRRGMASRVIGRKITKVEIGRERSVRRIGREAVMTGLTNTAIVDVRRRGKYLLCDLDSGDVMMIHLRMSGRVLVEESHIHRLPHTHVVLQLSDPNPTNRALLTAESREILELRFVDPRTFGEVVVYDPADEHVIVPELARLGIDPIEDAFDEEILATALRGRRGAVKPLLLNQRVVAGIGNIYADEILHRSRLRWNRSVDSLTRVHISRLARSISEVLEDAIDAGGSTLTDTQYVNVDGSFGRYQDEHRVYGRAGERCLTCGKGHIVRVSVAGRGTWYCPQCQR